MLQKYFQKAQKDVNEGRKSRARYDDYDYEADIDAEDGIMILIIE